MLISICPTYTSQKKKHKFLFWVVHAPRLCSKGKTGICHWTSHRSLTARRRLRMVWSLMWGLFHSGVSRAVCVAVWRRSHRCWSSIYRSCQRLVTRGLPLRERSAVLPVTVYQLLKWDMQLSWAATMARTRIPASILPMVLPRSRLESLVMEV
jgi:hypothetical protein